MTNEHDNLQINRHANLIIYCISDADDYYAYARNMVSIRFQFQFLPHTNEKSTTNFYCENKK